MTGNVMVIGNNNIQNFPGNNPRLRKVYFSIRNKSSVSTSFCKFAITFIDIPSVDFVSR